MQIPRLLPRVEFRVVSEIYLFIYLSLYLDLPFNKSPQNLITSSPNILYYETVQLFQENFSLSLVPPLSLFIILDCLIFFFFLIVLQQS